MIKVQDMSKQPVHVHDVVVLRLRHVEYVPILYVRAMIKNSSNFLLYKYLK